MRGGEGGQWTSAIISRRHKDGTCKVLYKDDSTESHVPISRMAVTASSAVLTSEATAGTPLSPARSHPGIAFSGGEDNSHIINLIDEQLPRTGAASADNMRASRGEAGGSSAEDCAEETTSTADLIQWLETELESPKGNATAAGSDGDDEGSPVSSKRPAAREPVRTIAERHAETAPPQAHDASQHYSKSTLREVCATFEEPPLGLTLTANARNEAEISKLVDGGRAMAQGLAVGDVLVRIQSRHVVRYDEAMVLLPGSAYPLSLLFRRQFEDTAAVS